MERKRLNRREFLIQAVVAAGGVTLAACQPKPAAPEATQEVPVQATTQATTAAQPAAPEEVVELEVMWRTDPAETKGLEEVIALWASKRSDIVLKTVYAPWDEFETKLMSLHAGGIAPALIGIGGTNPYCERYIRGMVQAMEPYLDADATLAADIYDIAVQTCSVNGHLYLMPATICGTGTYYNATLFEAAGVPIPPVEWKGTAWTWDDMIEAAKALTVDKNGDGKIDQYGMNPSHGSPWTYARLWGQDVVSEDDYASGILHKWQTDKPDVYDAVIAGVQARVDAIYLHKVAPTPEAQATLSQMGSMLKTGAIAMTFEGSWAAMPPMPEEFSFGAGPNPLGTPSKGTGTRGKFQAFDGWQISVQAKNPDAAWEFAKFYMTDAEAVKARVKNIAYLPACKSGLAPWLDENTNVLKAMTREGLEQTLNESLEVAEGKTPFRSMGSPCCHLVGWTAARDIFNAELQPAWSGQKSAKEAVDTMIPLINDAIQKHLEGLGLA